jgi:TatD DNase family protein
VALAHTYDEIAACVGIHPDDADCATEAVLETLASLAEDARVVAIGETGLDYRGSSAKEPQQRALRDQVRLARAVQKPLVIHTRAAAADTVAILREESAHHVGGVVHSCTEGVDFARAMLDLEFDIALSPLLQRFDEARALARFVPSDRMLLETSAPYHPPKGAARAEPAALPLVADLVAELVGGVKADDVARWTARNALRRFGLEALPEASHRSLPSLRPATLARADPKRP